MAFLTTLDNCKKFWGERRVLEDQGVNHEITPHIISGPPCYY